MRAASLEVRPVVPADQYVRLNERERATRAPLDASVERLLERRAKRWRGFHDDVFAPRFNRSPYARLREGAPAPPKLLPESQRPRTPNGLPIRTVRVAFIRIDFLTDREGDQSTGDGHFDLSGPDTLIPPVDRPPRNKTFFNAHLEALSRYYDAQSYGLIHVEGDVWPRERDRAYSVSDMADFGPWTFSQDIYPAAVHMFRTFTLAADSQSIVIGDRIPWADYDRIVFIHAGSDLQSDVQQNSPRDIPSFTIGVDDTDAVIFPDSTNRTRPIDRASFIPETGSQDGYYGAINGVIAHECGHLMFGFVDVYDVNSGLPVVGFWSLMDYGNGVGSIVKMPNGEEIFATGFLPPSLDPWQRFRFMLNDQLLVPEMAYGDTTPIHDVERNPDVWRVTLSSDEYLMLENRWQAPTDSVVVDQDDTSRVVLGPKKPDRFEYDALLPGSGILVWHVDESVFPFESSFPIDTSFRVNPDFGLNSNPARRGLSIIEADALADLGDTGSPFLLGARTDPWFRTNNPTLSDTTKPNLIPHIGTKPHTRLDFLDDPDSVMQVAAFRVWQLPGWPLFVDIPPGGPQLLAVDADGSGNRQLEVCWAGGADTVFALGPDRNGDGAPDVIRVPNPDSAAIFVVHADGTGIRGPADAVLARLDARPREVMAAWPLGESIGGGQPPDGPSVFAASTYPPGRKVWLIDGSPGNLGAVRPNWPPALPAGVTTPPVIANATVYVGCDDGRVYAIGLDGTVLGATDPPLGGEISGRLAVCTDAPSVVPASGARTGGGGLGATRIAAGSRAGDVAIFSLDFHPLPGWPRTIAGPGFAPEFLWIDFGGAHDVQQDCRRGALSLVVHQADWLWAFCAQSGEPLPGWGRDVGDTLVVGLGAGDPDGDGFPEVLTQSIHSEVTFWNVSGYPSPGWPRKSTREEFPARYDDDGNLIVDRRLTESPPVAADVDGDGLTDILAMNASGIVAALTASKKTPPGWPLATGLGTVGAPVAADLDRDGTLEVIAPDRFGVLYGYSATVPPNPRRAIEWLMVGGDPGRTASLQLDPSLYAAAPEAAPGPLVSGSLMAYPNPARRSPVSFAFRLSEPAEVEFRILDTSGHEVAAFERRGRQADNLEIWNPGSLPAGLYMARLRFRGAGTDRTEVLPIGVLR